MTVSPLKKKTTIPSIICAEWTGRTAGNWNTIPFLSPINKQLEFPFFIKKEKTREDVNPRAEKLHQHRRIDAPMKLTSPSSHSHRQFAFDHARIIAYLSGCSITLRAFKKLRRTRGFHELVKTRSFSPPFSFSQLSKLAGPPEANRREMGLAGTHLCATVVHGVPHEAGAPSLGPQRRHAAAAPRRAASPPCTPRMGQTPRQAVLSVYIAAEHLRRFASSSPRG